MAAPMPIKVYYCCVPEDEKLLDELQHHLAALKLQRLITHRFDRKILPGQDLQREIAKEINAAEVILLLVSADFLASEYFVTNINLVLDRHSTGKAVVIPILLRPANFQGLPIERLRMLPTNESCAAGAPPRMKKGRIPAGRSNVRDRLDTRAASRTTNVIWMPPKHHRLSLSSEKHVGEFLILAWHPIARPVSLQSAKEVTDAACV